MTYNVLMGLPCSLTRSLAQSLIFELFVICTCEGPELPENIPLNRRRLGGATLTHVKVKSDRCNSSMRVCVSSYSYCESRLHGSELARWTKAST